MDEYKSPVQFVSIFLLLTGDVFTLPKLITAGSTHGIQRLSSSRCVYHKDISLIESCNFDNSYCSFSHPPNSYPSIGWEIKNTKRSGINSLHDGPYLYPHCIGRPTGQFSSINTTINAGSVCIQFWYSMIMSTSNLEVLADAPDGKMSLWQKRGKQGDTWKKATLAVSSEAQFKIEFKFVRINYNSYTGFDDVKIWKYPESTTASQTTDISSVPLTTATTQPMETLSSTILTTTTKNRKVPTTITKLLTTSSKKTKTKFKPKSIGPTSSSSSSKITTTGKTKLPAITTKDLITNVSLATLNTTATSKTHKPTLQTPSTTLSAGSSMPLSATTTKTVETTSKLPQTSLSSHTSTPESTTTSQATTASTIPIPTTTRTTFKPTASPPAASTILSKLTPTMTKASPTSISSLKPRITTIQTDITSEATTIQPIEMTSYSLMSSTLESPTKSVNNSNEKAGTEITTEVTSHYPSEYITELNTQISTKATSEVPNASTVLAQSTISQPSRLTSKQASSPRTTESENISTNIMLGSTQSASSREANNSIIGPTNSSHVITNKSTENSKSSSPSIIGPTNSSHVVSKTSTEKSKSSSPQILHSTHFARPPSSASLSTPSGSSVIIKHSTNGPFTTADVGTNNKQAQTYANKHKAGIIAGSAIACAAVVLGLFLIIWKVQKAKHNKTQVQKSYINDDHIPEHLKMKGMAKRS